MLFFIEEKRGLKHLNIYLQLFHIMDKIRIYDNFLDSDDLQILISKLENYTWKYGQTSRSAQEKVNTPFWSIALCSEPFFTEYLKEIIEEKTSMKFSLVRVYANGQTYGQNGSYHIDSEDSNNWTFCLCLKTIWL